MSQASFSHGWIQAVTWCQQKSFCLHFLSFFPVLTSFSSRLLSHLGKLASSTSRFLSDQLHYPNGRRESLPGICNNMPGIDTQWCALGHMPIPEQTAMAKGTEPSDWLSLSHMPTREPWRKWGWSGFTKEIWVLLLEKERINAAKSTVVPQNWDGCSWSVHKPLVRSLLLEHYPVGPFLLLHKNC